MRKNFVGHTLFCAGIFMFMIPVAIAGCPIIQPNYERVCGTANPEFLKSIDEIGGCFVMPVNARSKWNATGIRLLAGKNYSFEIVDKMGTWKDAGIETDANGWTIESQQDIGLFTRLFVKLTAPLRRTADRNWFYLMGMVAEVGDELFAIGKEREKPYNLKRSGEFCAFANDLPWMYGNNSGSIRLRVGTPKRKTKTEE